MNKIIAVLMILTIILLVGCKKTIVVEEEAEYEIFSGVDTNTPEYEDYASCVDACGDCIDRCEQRLFFEVNLCDDVKNENTKQECFDKVYYAEALDTGAIAKCEDIVNEDEKRSCKISITMQKAVDQNNIGLCDELEEGMDDCRNNYYFESAVAESDVSYCDMLEGDFKENCISIVQPPSADEEE